MDYGPSLITNQPGALFEFQSDASFQGVLWGGGMTFNNAGTLRKSAGVGTSVFDSCCQFNNTGTVDLRSGTVSFSSFDQTAGDTQLAGGSMSGGSFNFAGGTLSGSGAIDASVVNRAVVSPGSHLGTLTINGNYTQTGAGVLQMELGGTSSDQFDKLVVTGIATLSGALDVSLVGGYQPGDGSIFNVVSFGSHSGVFSSLVFSNAPSDLALVPSYGSTNLVLGAQGTRTIANPILVGHNFSLSVSTALGPTYTLEYKNSLMEAVWTAAQTLPGTGGTITLTDGAATNQTRFYRIRVQ